MSSYSTFHVFEKSILPRHFQKEWNLVYYVLNNANALKLWKQYDVIDHNFFMFSSILNKISSLINNFLL